MRKVLVILLALAFVLPASAQVKIIKHSQIWDTTPDSLNGGDNTNISNPVSFIVTAPGGKTQLADNVYINLAGVTKTDDDSLTVYMRGSIFGDSTKVNLDTLTIPIGVSTGSIVKLSPTVMPDAGIFYLTGEAASSADTVLYKMEVVVEADEGE